MQVIYQIGEFVGPSIGHSSAYDSILGLSKKGYLKKFVSLNDLEYVIGKTYGNVNLNQNPKFHEVARRSFVLKSFFNEQYIHGMLIPNVFDIYSALFKVEKCDIFHVWNNYGLFSLRKARRLGAKIVVERAFSYIVYQHKLLQEEFVKWGNSFKISKTILYRQIKELDEADYVLVPSEFARQSFLEYGFPKEKVVKIPFGVKLSRESINSESSLLASFKEGKKV